MHALPAVVAVCALVLLLALQLAVRRPPGPRAALSLRWATRRRAWRVVSGLDADVPPDSWGRFAWPLVALAAIAVAGLPWALRAHAGTPALDSGFLSVEREVLGTLTAVPAAIVVLAVTVLVDRAGRAFPLLLKGTLLLPVLTLDAIVLALGAAVLGGYGNQEPEPGGGATGWAFTVLSCACVVGDVLSLVVILSTVRVLRPERVAAVRAQALAESVDRLLAGEVAARTSAATLLSLLPGRAQAPGAADVLVVTGGDRLARVADVRVGVLRLALGGRRPTSVAALDDLVGPTTALMAVPALLGPARRRLVRAAFRLAPSSGRPRHLAGDDTRLAGLGELGEELQEVVDDLGRAVSRRDARQLDAGLRTVVAALRRAAAAARPDGFALAASVPAAAPPAQPAWAGTGLSAVMPSVETVVDAAVATGQRDMLRAVLGFGHALNAASLRTRGPLLYELARRLDTTVVEASYGLARDRGWELRRQAVDAYAGVRDLYAVWGGAPDGHDTVHRVLGPDGLPAGSVNGSVAAWTTATLTVREHACADLGRRLVDRGDAQSVRRLLLASADQNTAALVENEERSLRLAAGLDGYPRPDEPAATVPEAVHVLAAVRGHVLAAARQRRGLVLNLLGWSVRQTREADEVGLEWLKLSRAACARVLAHHLAAAATPGQATRLLAAYRAATAKDLPADTFDWRLGETVAGTVVRDGGEDLAAAAVLALAVTPTPPGTAPAAAFFAALGDDVLARYDRLAAAIDGVDDDAAAVGLGQLASPATALRAALDGARAAALSARRARVAGTPLRGDLEAHVAAVARSALRAGRKGHLGPPWPTGSGERPGRRRGYGAALDLAVVRPILLDGVDGLVAPATGLPALLETALLDDVAACLPARVVAPDALLAAVQDAVARLAGQTGTGGEVHVVAPDDWDVRDALSPAMAEGRLGTPAGPSAVFHTGAGLQPRVLVLDLSRLGRWPDRDDDTVAVTVDETDLDPGGDLPVHRVTVTTRRYWNLLDRSAGIVLAVGPPPRPGAAGA